MSDNSFELESEYSTYSFNSSKTENDSFKKQMDNISVEEMKEIFKDNKNEEDKDDLSCKENEVESNENIANSTPAEHKTSLFRTSISDRINDTTLLKNKKRGRKSNSEEEKEKSHDKYSPDNVKRKIQVHYLSFITLIINVILDSCGIREKFYKLEYEFKRIVNKKHFNYLINSKIGDIISKEISNKYKKKRKDNNSNVYNYFIANKVLEGIFEMKYLDFFRMFYMKKEKIVDLKIIGIDKIITLSEKTETYYDLLEKLKKENDEKYIKLIDECIKNNYLSERFALY
jgi:hypothetical protein